MARERLDARVTSAGSAPRALFQAGEVRVEVQCPREDDLGWLEEFLSPPFQRRPPTPVVDYTVEAVVDGDLHRRLAATRPPGDLPETVTFVLDQGVMRAPWWRHLVGRQRVLADDAHGVLYVVPDNAARVTVVAPAGGRFFRGAVMRIVREIAMARAWSRTRMVVHASALSIDGMAIVIAGPKHSGKTSLLIHCLRAPGAAYVSNDRVLLSLAKPAPTAQGVPALVMLRRGTLDLFPELARSVARHGYQAHLMMAECRAGASPAPGSEADATPISPAQLCRLLGVSMAGEVRVGAFLLPRVDPGCSGIACERLSPDEAASRFDTVLFGAASAVRTSEAFRAAGTPPPASPAGSQSLWTRLVGDVPVFACRIGKDAFNEPAASHILRPILPALAGFGS